MKALYLSGGSVRGAYQIGILKHLILDKKINYDLYIGVSVGAINAAFLAMFIDPVEGIIELEKVWLNITTKDIYTGWNTWKIFNYLKAPWRQSLYNNEPLIKLISKHIDSIRIITSNKKLLIGAYNLNTGKYHLFNEQYKNIQRAVLASGSIPIAFPPTKIGNEYYVDGALKPFVPFKAATLLGINTIDVICTSPKKEPKNYEESPSIVKLGPRIIEIMSDEIMTADLNRAVEINNLIKNGAVIPGKKYININIIRPNKKLVESSLNFEQSVIQPMIQKGYEDAVSLFRNL
jgi:NTE family protein